MVLKNPYGYLIKHFRLIHLVLAGIYIYLAIKVNSILMYYNRFIDGSASKLDAIHYVTNYYLIGIIVSFVICFVVYILMRYKKKPRFMYLLLIVIYIVVGIMIGISYRGLNTIYISVLETKTLRLYRDLLNIIILVQYASIFIVMFRGLGFDIKKFNFASDVADLQLEDEDVEEIEVAFGENRSIERRFRRGIREFKYYFLENKAFIFLLVVIVLVVVIGSSYYHVEVVDKVYQQGEVFSTERFRFQVLDTYVTNRDNNNSVVGSSNYRFVIVKMIIGVNQESSEFNVANLVLKIGNQTYSSSNRYANSFSDLGTAYKGSKINNQMPYIFIYSVSNDDMDGAMVLDYAGEKKVKLNPIDLDEVVEEETFHVSDKLNLENSVFGTGYFMISSYEINKQFSYDYQYEVMGNSHTGHLTISGNNMILHLVVSSQMPSLVSNYSFLSSMGKLKYQLENGEIVTSSLSDKTPVGYLDGLYLSVDKEIENASHIWFEIIVRQRKYIYYLK